IERRTVRANVFIIVAHIAENVWMIERRQGADTHELFGADLYLGHADIVVEMRNDMLGHVLDWQRGRQTPYPVETAVSTTRSEKAANLWQVRTEITMELRRRNVLIGIARHPAG